jgi:Gamma-glutamyltranspeptidase
MSCSVSSNITSPQSDRLSSIGGGFMLVRSPVGSYEFIDFQETAPGASYESMYNNNTALSLYGGLVAPQVSYGAWSICTISIASSRGRLVVKPSVNLAGHGFEATVDTVRYMSSAVGGGHLTLPRRHPQRSRRHNDAQTIRRHPRNHRRIWRGRVLHRCHCKRNYQRAT